MKNDKEKEKTENIKKVVKELAVAKNKIKKFKGWYFVKTY